MPEDLDLKRKIFAGLAGRQPSTTVLATNTSSIDIDDIADDVADPERVLGLHFFNPPPVMRLVEVVHGERTAQAYVEHATRAHDGLGQDAGPVQLDPGLHRQPGGAPLLRRGAADRRERASPTRRRSTGSSVSAEASRWGRSS